jgi:hypothetical protein
MKSKNEEELYLYLGKCPKAIACPDAQKFFPDKESTSTGLPNRLFFLRLKKYFTGREYNFDL